MSAASRHADADDGVGHPIGDGPAPHLDADDDEEEEDGLLAGDDGIEMGNTTGGGGSHGGSNGNGASPSRTRGGRGRGGLMRLLRSRNGMLACVGVAAFLVVVALVMTRSDESGGRTPAGSGSGDGVGTKQTGSNWVSPSWAGPPSGGPITYEPKMAYADYLSQLQAPARGDVLAPRPSVGTYEKWVVITSIALPTEAIVRLAELGDWHVVVVADLKSPPTADFQKKLDELDGGAGKRVHFLSNEMQDATNAEKGWVGREYESSAQVPHNHYTRKTLGYLFAIQHGAKTIYETDDDNILLPNLHNQNAFEAYWLPGTVSKPLLQFCPNKLGIQVGDGTGKGVISRTQKVQLPGRIVLNPYAHFGQPSVWPRGYPLEFIDFSKQHQESVIQPDTDVWKASPLAYTYSECVGTKPLVQQGVANGDPDVDAIYRLTRRFSEKIEITFDSNAAPVMLPRGLMTPFNSQHTLFHYDAFWGLLIPKTTSFRVCDIWRGYWTQRLLWEVGGGLTFLGPGVYQDRNVHSYLKDFIDEKALYDDAGRLVRFLLGWRPTVAAVAGDSATTDLFPVILQLSYDMAREGFWEFGDVDLVVAWLRDLKRVGYNPPLRVVFSATTKPSSDGTCVPHTLTDAEYRNARLEVSYHEAVRAQEVSGSPAPSARI